MRLLADRAAPPGGTSSFDGEDDGDSGGEASSKGCCRSFIFLLMISTGALAIGAAVAGAGAVDLAEGIAISATERGARFDCFTAFSLPFLNDEDEPDSHSLRTPNPPPPLGPDETFLAFLAAATGSGIIPRIGEDAGEEVAEVSEGS